MTQPQRTQSSQTVLRAQQLWRLKERLTGPGDVFEMNTSARSIVIGPNSDLRSVRLHYFDPNRPDATEEIVVSVASPYIGRLDSSLADIYPASNLKAKTIITPNDIFQNGFLPPGFSADPAVNIVSFTPPRIDLLCYLSDMPAYPVRRADFFTQGLVTILDEGGGTGKTAIMVPFYGRRYATVSIGNFSGAAFTLDVQGMFFTPQSVNQTALKDFNPAGTIISTSTGLATTVAIDTNTQPPNPVPNPAGVTIPANIGKCDYLLVIISGNAIDSSTVTAPWLSIRCSDE